MTSSICLLDQRFRESFRKMVAENAKDLLLHCVNIGLHLQRASEPVELWASSVSSGWKRGDVMFSLTVCVAGRGQHAAGQGRTMTQSRPEQPSRTKSKNKDKKSSLLFLTHKTP